MILFENFVTLHLETRCMPKSFKDIKHVLEITQK